METTTTVTTKVPVRTSRAARIGLPLAAFGLLGLGGALEGIPRIENDLEERVEERARTLGINGITAEFSGQDGTIRCTTALSDTDRTRLLDKAEQRWGVRVVDFDESCATTTPPATDPVTTDPITTDPAPTTDPEQPADIVELAASDPEFSTLAGLLADTGLDATLQGDGPFTVFAPTNDAFAALDPAVLEALQADPDLLSAVLTYHVVDGALLSPALTAGELTTVQGETVAIDLDGPTVNDAAILRPDILASNGVVHGIDTVLVPQAVLDALGAASPSEAVATFDNGVFTLTGTVANEQQRQSLVAAAGRVVDPANVVDQLVVDPAVAITDEQVAGVARMVEATPPNLVSGRMGWNGAFFASGIFRGEAERAAFEAVATEVGADVDLAPRPDGAECDVADLTAQLNDAVEAQPVQFDSGRATIQAASNPTLDVVAAIAGECTGIGIEVVGHTDSSGSDATNQRLSEQRAAAVVQALVDRGVPADSLTAQGRGETELIIIDGVEDQTASRRVEFAVTVN